MSTPSTPAQIGMYQGEDWSQQLSFYADTQLTTPLVFDNPVMDIRTSRTLLATFDLSGTKEGTAAIPTPGVLVLSMPHTETVAIPDGTYDLDIFADVAGKRQAITKAGVIQLVVTARITQDAP